MRLVSSGKREGSSLERLVGPFPPSQLPELYEDGCSVEVLVESHAGFYVGYYSSGEWYDSLHGDKLWQQFKPWRWWHLPARANRPNE